MSKFHINDKGEVGKCEAEIKCRFSEKEEHFETQTEARAYYEQKMEKEIFENMPKVKVSKSGKITWRSKEERIEAIAKEAEHMGYTIKVPTSHLTRKYLVARSATQVSGLIENAFTTENSLNKYLAEKNRAGMYHNSYDVVLRDTFEQAAAKRLIEAS